MADYKTTLAFIMQDGVSPVAAKIVASIADITKSVETLDKLIAANQQSMDAWAKKLAAAPKGSKEWHEAASVLKQLQGEAQRLGATKVEVETNLKTVAGEVGQLGKATEEAGGRLTMFRSILMGIGMGVGLGIFNAITGAIQQLASIIPNLIGQGQQFAATIDNITDSTSASAEEVSRLAGIFQYVGIPVSTLQMMLPRLTSMLETNAEKWEALGVELYDAEGNMKSGIELLDALRQKLGGVIGAGGENVLDDLLGGRQSWAQIADYLKLTDEQVAMLTVRVEDLGYAMSSTGAAAAEGAQRAQNEFGMAVQGIANTLAVSIAPVLTQVISAITEFIRQNIAAIQAFIAQVAGFVMGFVEGILSALGTVTSFTQSMSAVGAATAQTTDAYRNYVSTMAKAEQQAPRTANAASVGANRQVEAARRIDQQQERTFRRQLARIDGILRAQLDALDKADEKQDRTRSREDLQKQVLIAETRVRAGFDPTAADELKKAQQDLADFEAGVVRDAARDRINTAQETIRKITEAESYAATTRQAIRDIARIQDQAEHKRAEAIKRGDYAEARRQELVIDAAIATRRRLLQKKTNEDLIRSLSAATRAVASAARAQTGYWTQELARLQKERDAKNKETEKGTKLTADSVKDQWTLVTDLIKGKSTQAASSIYGSPGSIAWTMEEARKAGNRWAKELVNTLQRDVIPKLKELGGWLAAIADVLSKLGGLFGPSEGYRRAMAAWQAKMSASRKQGRFGNAEGGIVQGGNTALVGELGPELITVGSTSRVIPNNQLDTGRELAPVVIPVTIDGREVARITDRHLYWAYQLAPNSSRG